MKANGRPPEKVQIAARIDAALYDKIKRRQRASKQNTGIEPSISQVVCAMIDEACDAGPRRR